MGKVCLSGPVGFTRYVSIVNESPGIGGACRNDVSVAISRANSKWTCRADGFIDWLDKRFRIYLNTYLEGLSNAIARDARSWRHGIDDSLYRVGGIGECLANLVLRRCNGRFSADIIVCSYSPSIGSTSRDDIYCSIAIYKPFYG